MLVPSDSYRYFILLAVGLGILAFVGECIAIQVNKWKKK